jgi:hypothetical protein
VATLKLLDRRGSPMHPPAPPLLRGAVLTQYDPPGLWTNPSASPQSFPVDTQGGVPASLTSGPVISAATASVEQQFNIAPRALGAPTVLALATAVEIVTDQPASFQYDRSTQTIRFTGGGLLSSYSIRSEPNPDEQTLQKLAGGERPHPFVIGGYDRPEVRDLARDLLRRAGLATEPPHDSVERREWNRSAAGTFKAHLQSGRYIYQTNLSDLSTQGKPGEGPDPIARFLLETRRGHCEYFASALTALCQSVGIPARLVTGFAAIEYDQDSSTYVIRESNAHAWTEVLVGEFRWLTLDPTPAGALNGEITAGRSFGDWLRGLYDSFEFRWNLHVVSFDSRMQSQVVTNLSAAWLPHWDELVAAVLDWMRRVNVFFDLGPAGYVWLGIVAFAALLAIIATVKITRRMLRLRAVLRLRTLRGARRAKMLRQLGFYLDMLGLLERGGSAKPQWIPPAQFAGHLQRTDPALGGLVGELTSLFYLARFGGRDLDREQMSRAARLLQDLADRLRISL